MLGVWTGQQSPVRDYIDPQGVGRRMGEVAVNGTRVAYAAIHLLATHWPEAQFEPFEPSESGKALLARAGALAEEPESNQYQVAEAPSGSSMR